MRRRIDDGEVYAARLGLLQKPREFAGGRGDGVELHDGRAARVPLEGAALRIDVENGDLEFAARGANRHVNSHGRFSAAVLLR